MGGNKTLPSLGHQKASQAPMVMGGATNWGWDRAEPWRGAVWPVKPEGPEVSISVIGELWEGRKVACSLPYPGDLEQSWYTVGVQ